MAILKLGKPIKTIGGTVSANRNDVAVTPIYKVIHYVINGAKTQDGALVSSNYISGYNPIVLAKQMYRDLHDAPCGIGDNTRWALHLKQSFAPDEPITPEVAHRIGELLAEQITQGEYKYVVATHVDRQHIHNHIVICMASQHKPHAHMQLKKDAIDTWRNLNDELCKQYGLSVLPPSKGEPATYARDFSDIYTDIKGIGEKARLRALIDDVIMHTNSFEEFEQAMHNSGFSMYMRGNNLVYVNDITGMKVRSSKLGYAYTPNHIISRINGKAYGWVSVNEALIHKQTLDAITFYLPHSKRQLTVNVPQELLMKTNHTYHWFMAEDANIIVTDRRGRYVKTITNQELYKYFGDKSLTAEQALYKAKPTRKEHVVLARSEAQEHYLRYQARQVDELNEQVDQLMQVRLAIENGSDINDRISQLKQQIDTSVQEIKATFTALVEAEHTGDATGAQELRDQLTAIETHITTLNNEIRQLNDFIQQHREHNEQQRRTHRR